MNASRANPAPRPPRTDDPASESPSYLVAPTLGWVLVQLAGIRPTLLRTPGDVQGRRFEPESHGESGYNVRRVP